MQIVSYLHFNGQCEEAFKFYERALGGKIEAMFLNEGLPSDSQVPPEWRKKVMHARLVVGDQEIMGSDPPPGWYRQPQGFSISLHFQDAGQAERVFKALADGGKIKMPFEKTFWAERFGMVEDKFGIPWMVNYEGVARG